MPSRLQKHATIQHYRGSCTCVCSHDQSRDSFVVTLFSCLTVVVPGEADPQVVVLGVVEVPDELHLGPAVNGRQLPLDGLTVMLGLRPGETLLAVVREVAVVAVGHPERQTHPGAGGRGGRRRL